MAQEHPVLDIPIFHKAYDLYKLVHSYHHRIPKAQRYTLWQKCEGISLAVLEAIVEVQHQKADEKIRSLHKISCRLDLLKVFMRLAKETRTLDDKQYLAMQGIVQEIGRMIGGWIKSVPPSSAERA